MFSFFKIYKSEMPINDILVYEVWVKEDRNNGILTVMHPDSAYLESVVELIDLPLTIELGPIDNL